MIKISDLNIDEYPVYYNQYFDKLDTSIDVLEALKNQIEDRNNLLLKFDSLSKLDYAYSENKWSVKQVFSHVRDTEIIMNFRALCIARGEQKSIMGFDENLYQSTDKMELFSVNSFIHQAELLTKANLALFESYSQEDLLRKGISNNYEVSVRGIICVIYAHEEHHLRILKERYL